MEEAGAGAGARARAAGGDEGQEDAVLLAPLTEESFLHNLHVRYKRDIIYTWIGNALVSVNPCRALPLYSAELLRAYLARPPYHLPPHLYALTATAHRWVRDRNESQCIVITGESGAGKTEAARVCLQCVVVAGGEGAEAGEAGARLTAGGTLLEAFGNAATLRNHNASRFGKLLEIELDRRGRPIAGHITHYLLEKERSCSVSDGERNFHVLYQLLAGADVHLLKRLKLQRSWEHYRILCPGGGCRSPRRAPPTPPPRARSPARPASTPDPHKAAQHDVDHFAFTKAAMATLGFGGGECGAVLRLLAFMLKLGNVQFEPQHNIDGTIGTRIHHLSEVKEACSLVGVDAAALTQALTQSAHVPHVPADARDDEERDADADADVGSGSGSECEADADAEVDGGGEWARASLRRLLAAVYARLFTWLVRRVNAALQRDGPEAVGGCGDVTLGVLDVYGLERLERNGLERLLINYAAERVQGAVTRCTLRRDQEEWAREGLAWRALPFPPHDLRADLLDVGPDSLLATLQRAPPDALLPRLQRVAHARLLPHPPDHFTVVHYGGGVTYDARGMVSQNRDALCRRCGGVLGSAGEPLLAELFAESADGRRRAGTLACRQRALVGALVRRLTTAEAAPRLVRCLLGEAALRPRRWDAALVRQQVRSQALLELAALRRAGWCDSMCARALLRRYAALAPPASRPAARAASASASCPAAAVRAARALLGALPIPRAEFAFGRTRVFIRSPRTVWELEALRATRVDALVTRAQRAWRQHRRHRAQRVIACAWRRWRRAAGGGGGGAGGGGGGATLAAARRVWAWWCAAARRRYVRRLAARLPARHRSPACDAWPPVPQPRLLGRADALLRRLHHAWRCREYRARLDQTARNRMREKATASALFRGRKALYACSVPHPFVGDYVRLRGSGAWRRGAPPDDQYVVFADACGKVARASGRVAPALCVVSTAALLVLEARSLRVRRRVQARDVWRLSLSPHADDVLVVHVRPPAATLTTHPHLEHHLEPLLEPDLCSERDHPPGAGCLFAGESRRRGDVVLRTCHVLELATKLFLVVQNAVGTPPQVHIATEFEANFGTQVVTIAFHELGDGGGARLLRRHDRMDVLL